MDDTLRQTVTTRDGADLAGAIATVSCVLNNIVPISATRDRVLQATSLLGYRPNATARSPKASETRLISYARHDVPLSQMIR